MTIVFALGRPCREIVLALFLKFDKKIMATSDKVKCENALKRKTLPVKELEKLWITGAEACALLGCSRDFLERLRENAEIRFAKIGGAYYHEVASIHRMFERHAVAAKSQRI